MLRSDSHHPSWGDVRRIAAGSGCQNVRPTRIAKSTFYGVEKMKSVLALPCLVLLLTFAPPAPAQDITVRYDRFKDVTVVSSGRIHVLDCACKNAHFDMVVSFGYQGHTPAAPQTVVFGFVADSLNARYVSDNSLNAIVDGGRVPLANQMVRTAQVKRVGSVVWTEETLLMNLPVSTFVRIAQAGKVEMQLGSTEFELDADVLATLRRLVDRMKPEQLKAPEQTSAPGQPQQDRIYKSSEVTRRACFTHLPTVFPTNEAVNAAKNKATEWVVRLRVVLAASGEVTNIAVVHAQPYGLTERAIEAARQVKFVPASLNGRPVSQWAVLEFPFRVD